METRFSSWPPGAASGAPGIRRRFVVSRISLSTQTFQPGVPSGTLIASGTVYGGPGKFVGSVAIDDTRFQIGLVQGDTFELRTLGPGPIGRTQAVIVVQPQIGDAYAQTFVLSDVLQQFADTISFLGLGRFIPRAFIQPRLLVARGAGAFSVRPFQRLASSAQFAGEGASVFMAALRQRIVASTAFAGEGASFFEAGLRFRQNAAAGFGGAGFSAFDPSVEHFFARGGAASFAGSGEFDAVTAALRMAAAASYAGTGSLSAGVGLIQSGQTAFSGSGNLVLSAAEQLAALVGYSGTGSFSPAVSSLLEAAASTFAGSGTGTFSGALRVLQPSGFANFFGSGGMVASSRRRLPGSSGFAGAGSFSASVRERLVARAAFAGTGAFAPQALVGLTPGGSARLLGQGAFAANPDAAFGFHDVRATQSKSSGKYYFEVSSNQLTSDDAIGLANSTAALNTKLGSNANGIALYPGLGVYQNGFQVLSWTTAYNANDSIGIAVDLDTRRVWFRLSGSGIWNNSGTAAPGGTGWLDISGITGALFPAATLYRVGDRLAGRFRAAAFGGSIPAGYSAWDATSPTAWQALPGVFAGVGSFSPQRTGIVLGGAVFAGTGKLVAFPPTATLSITFNPASPTSISNTTPVRTVIMTMQAAWSNEQPFLGSYEFVAPHYDGSNAPVSGTSAVNSVFNYALGDVVNASDTAGITSTGTYAIVRCPNSLGCVIINPNGPGVGSAGGSTQDISVDAYE